MMSEDEQGSNSSGDDILKLRQAARRNFQDAYYGWRENPTIETETAMLRAAVQVLHSAAISADPAERLALDLVGSVLSDRLDGWGWPSLTHVGTRRGTNSYQASAKRLGAGYIQTVDAGHYQDPDPWKTVMDIFNRSRKQVRRWLNDYPDLTLHRQLSQDEAINEMKVFSVYLNRGPSKTTPIMSAWTAPIMSACKSEEGA
jgi:hypothetical protein